MNTITISISVITLIIIIILVGIGVWWWRGRKTTEEEVATTEGFTQSDIDRVYINALKYLRTENPTKPVPYSEFNLTVGGILPYVKYEQLRKLSKKPNFSKTSVRMLLGE